MRKTPKEKKKWSIKEETTGYAKNREHNPINNLDLGDQQGNENPINSMEYLMKDLTEMVTASTKGRVITWITFTWG